MTLTEEQRRRRGRNMAGAIHSVEMEGGYVDAETQRQMAAYARGELTAEELRQRALDHAWAIAADDGQAE